MASMSIRILLSCRTSALLRSPLFCIRFSSHSPPAPNPQTPQNPIANFLLTECDFSLTQVSKIMQTNKKLLKTRSSHTAREAIQFLEQWGFTQSQIHATILRYPGVLEMKVDTRLKPKFLYFQTLGFTDQDLKYLISTHPRVLTNSLEGTIIPKISILENLLGAKRNVINAVKRSPILLDNSIERKLKPKLDFLEQRGIQGELLSLLLNIEPRILGRCSLEMLREGMEYARNTMGIVEGSKKFIYAISVFLTNRPQTIETKKKQLQCLGLLEYEVREILIKKPWLLVYSTKKMQENMDFLTQTAGLKPNVVLSHPEILQYSVKKRLMPRHAVFKALLSSEQPPVHSLLTILKLTERRFLEKIVECHPEASMLKEIYKAEIDYAGIGTT